MGLTIGCGATSLCHVYPPADAVAVQRARPIPLRAACRSRAATVARILPHLSSPCSIEVIATTPHASVTANDGTVTHYHDAPR